ncbi:MAG TPA: helix-turn-helix transcriptional regulator [Solirubrobacterales bacterium]|nr:helix-turn-helix transcriptional regulator [Solirubrobacterales bacterium]
MASPKGQKETQRAETLGVLVRRLRRKRGDTLAELAERIPMSPSNLSRLELGKQGPPSDEIIERVAAALKVDATELLQAAGRVSGGASFEKQVLARLDQLDREVREVKAAIEDRPSKS